MKGIAIRRKAIKLSQSDLAVNLGVSSLTVSRWERGEQSPSVDMLIKIAKFFNCSIDSLLQEETQNPTQAPLAAALSGRRLKRRRGGAGCLPGRVKG